MPQPRKRLSSNLFLTDPHKTGGSFKVPTGFATQRVEIKSCRRINAPRGPCIEYAAKRLVKISCRDQQGTKGKDDADPDLDLNEVVWKAVQRENSVMPAPKQSAYGILEDKRS